MDLVFYLLLTQRKSKTLITRSVLCKFDCITVAFQRTQHIMLLDETQVYYTKCLILWWPWGLQIGEPYPGFPDYWFAPGARSHLQVYGVTEAEEVCLKLIPRVTPLNVHHISLFYVWVSSIILNKLWYYSIIDVDPPTTHLFPGVPTHRLKY